MDFSFILKGLGLGIAVSAPLGPLGVLCIQRTINKGFISGFISGFGAATADIIYALIAGLGISIIADFLEAQQLIIRGAGGIIVLVVGIMIFNSNPAKRLRKQKNQKNTYVSDFVSSFFITITNPLTVVFFGAVFAGFGLNNQESIEPVILTLSGIFIGALVYWMTLSIVVNLFRNKIRLRNLWWINKITGVIVAVFGIAVFVSIFFNWW